MNRRTLALAAAVTALFALALGAVAPAAGAQAASGRKNFEILETVIRYIKTDYIDEPDPRKVMDGAFQGLVNSLDILSAYLDKGQAAKYALSQKQRLMETGAILFKRAGAFPLVIGVVESSPAEKADIKMGDYLSAVNDQSVLIWSLSELDLALKDETAAPVKLRIIHENATKEVLVERADLAPRALTLTPQARTAGIATIRHLNPPLVAEFKTAILPKVRAEKNPLVLDLRDCHEGTIDEARAFLNLFLKSEKAGTFEAKGVSKEVLACPAQAPLEALPVVVWVNQATLGPAEIVAGVLKDLKKAKVIGLPTPGLAGRQDIYPLASGDALLLTTSVFVTAGGDKLWSKGVEPDVKLDLDKTDTKAYLEKTLGILARR